MLTKHRWGTEKRLEMGREKCSKKSGSHAKQRKDRDEDKFWVIFFIGCQIFEKNITKMVNTAFAVRINYLKKVTSVQMPVGS